MKWRYILAKVLCHKLRENIYLFSEITQPCMRKEEYILLINNFVLIKMSLDQLQCNEIDIFIALVVFIIIYS